MKSSERQHLKENDLAQSLSSAREFIEPRKKQVAGIVVVLVLVVVAVAGVMVIRDRTSHQGEDLLGEAMVALNAPVVPVEGGGEDLPAAAGFGARGSFSTEAAKLEAAAPKLKAAADAYPDSQAGITARYHLAGAYAALGRHADAIREFDDVVARAGANTIYGRMARLGRADTQLRANQIDAAIASWKELADQKDENLPTDAILMELGRAYVQKGNRDEARKAYTELVDQHPNSPYTGEARQELETLKRAVS